MADLHRIGKHLIDLDRVEAFVDNMDLKNPRMEEHQDSVTVVLPHAQIKLQGDDASNARRFIASVKTLTDLEDFINERRPSGPAGKP